LVATFPVQVIFEEQFGAVHLLVLGLNDHDLGIEKFFASGFCKNDFSGGNFMQGIDCEHQKTILTTSRPSFLSFSIIFWPI
jgi:hypothetical protein